jgi:hypothetical protein
MNTLYPRTETAPNKYEVTLPCGQVMTLFTLRGGVVFEQADERFQNILDAIAMHLECDPTIEDVQRYIPALLMQCYQFPELSAGIAAFVGCFVCEEYTEKGILALVPQLKPWSLADWEAFWRAVYDKHAVPFAMWRKMYIDENRGEQARLAMELYLSTAKDQEGDAGVMDGDATIQEGLDIADSGASSTDSPEDATSADGESVPA